MRRLLLLLGLLTLTVVSIYFNLNQTQAANGGEVLVVDAEGAVTPLMLLLIERAITEADIRNVELLVIRLDTPGGSIDLTKEIIQAIMRSDTPIAVYVWPPGGYAASAGTFITLSGHVAAMSPNTSIGAASPVNSSGEDIDETMKAKVENMLMADIRGLTDRRGEEAIEWAQSTISEANAATAEEALEIGVVDYIATDLDDLLTQLEGQTIEHQGESYTFTTKNSRITFLETTVMEDILGFLVNPAVALFLISLGSLALAYEFINPGGYVSGVIGLIALLTGLFAVGQLPINYAGLALIMLAMILFGAELFTPTHGVLSALGIASFIIGGVIMFNTDEFAYDIPWVALIGLPVGMASFVVFGLAKVVQTRHTQPVTGQEGILGSIGTVRVALEPEGTVFVWGETWRAISDTRQSIPVGISVEVTEIKGLRLTVKQVMEKTTVLSSEE